MKKFSLLIFFFLFITIACKKETKQADVNSSNALMCSCANEPKTNPIFDETPYFGVFGFTNYKKFVNDTTSSSYFEVQALTYRKGFNSYYYGSDMVNCVLLNNDTLRSSKDVNGLHIYYVSFLSKFPKTQNWQISSDSIIPSFSYDPCLQEPIGGFLMLPSTISKSNIKPFNVYSVSNITSGFIMVIDESGKSHYNTSIALHAGTNCVCLPEKDLNLMGPGKASLLVLLENTVYKIINGKNFKFSAKLQYTKEIELLP